MDWARWTLRAICSILERSLEHNGARSAMSIWAAKHAMTETISFLLSKNITSHDKFKKNPILGIFNCLG